MSWFKVDDGMHAHKKTRRAGVEAMGLWAICGSWSADNLEDGFVPDYIAEAITPKAQQYAKRLVSAGYWTVAEKDGDKGWRFHGWDEYQPTRDAVEEKREQWRERQRKARSQRKVSRDSHTSVTRDNSVSHADSHSESHAPVTESRPVPSRPVLLPTEVVVAPNSPEPVDKSGRAKRARTLPDGWKPTADDVAKLRGEHPDFDTHAEHVRFADYWKATGKPMKDWSAAWRNWMRRAATERRTRPNNAQQGVDWDAALARAEARDAERNAS